MKFFSLLSPSAPNLRLICVILYAATPLVRAISFKKVPAPNLNLGNLGRTVFTGDFTGISLYEYEGNSEDTLAKYGSQSLLQRMPDGRFANVASSDAGIQAMCLSKMNDGKLFGVVVGGDFTVLGGVQSPGAALFNPNTALVQPLTGLSGQISALYCDQSTNTVYAGGSFISANSTNVIQLVANEGWKDLPFQGFNGPVNSITKAYNGNIIFGGSFTGLGNVTKPTVQDQIQINLEDAQKIAGSSTSVPEFSDPANIICKTTGNDGPGNTWLLADRTPGYWRANFGYTFQPTKLRLWNTHLEGRGTKTFRFTAFPINGIMNLTYVDPLNNQINHCTSECPLSRESKQPYQDFNFVNVIGMNGFQIDISDWYGDGGGLAGIELSQTDIYSYAVSAFNEPSCAKTQSTSSVTTTGPWSVSPSAQSSAEYLSITSSTMPSSESDISVIFLPNIRQSGNYSVNMYTPGCIPDNSCERRGRIKITGIMSKEGTKEAGFSTEIFQTNNYDKYDQIYYGFVAASSDSFRPSVKITIAPGQADKNLTVVAQRVGFTLTSQSGGLNGLFEYDPNQIDMEIANFDNSSFVSIGKQFPAGAEVNELQTLGNTTFIGGNFTSQGFSNILKTSDGNPESLANNGLNGAVQTILISSTTLYVGGTFSSTAINGNLKLANVASYDTVSNTWNKLGGGVDGAVSKLVALQMNITKNKPETTIALTGKFTEVLGFDDNPSFPANGFAIWVPSVNNWFQNLDDPKLKIDGSLTTAIDLLDGTPLFAGSISSSQLSANDVAEIDSSGSSLMPFPIQMQHPLGLPRSSVQTTKDLNSSEIITGLFYARDSHNIVILGGHFSAIGSDGSEVNNLALVDSSNDNSVTGVGPSLSKESKILAMSVHEDTLFAGGSLTGTVNEANIGGIISYNLLTSTFDTQPPSLDGNVISIQSRQSTNEIYVGGNFTSAGSLSCPAVCQYSTSISQWNRPGNGLAGVANTMLWASPTSLIVGGDLTLNDVSTSLVIFDTKSLNWTTVVGSNVIPGPVSSIAKASNDGSHLWVAGYAKNGTAFLMKSDGDSWTPISHLLGPGTEVKGLQVLSLTSNHASSDIVPLNSVLLVIGALNLPAFGSASAALFNGTSFQPYIITSSINGGPGSLSKFFAEKEITFQSEDGKLAKVFVILISLAIALGLIMIIIIIGLLVERSRNKEERYSPAPTSTFERGNAITSRVPPDQLFGSITQGGRRAVDKQTTLI
ncbi:Polarized growth protein rax2 [Erysiphe neolycopersici]|uniref:Polarized growth protein rax2 n=1 Tax=Erysiphe neolycopersici TaxID=212602 RepID=A0A420I5Y4_9PEZI|nr:Polarized growth protein rax2 [Erysiphe neolycopersici]